MNDFTKEELSLCYRTIEYMVYKEIWFQPEIAKLKDKIQSMIDNYCEHDTDVSPLYTATGDIPCAGFCYKCGSCVSREHLDE